MMLSNGRVIFVTMTAWWRQWHSQNGTCTLWNNNFTPELNRALCTWEKRKHVSSLVFISGDSLYYHKNSQFSTKDVDHDAHTSGSCSHNSRGAWWYKCCHYANLNALYYKKSDPPGYAIGVTWRTWKGLNESLKSTSMKTRPVGFTPGEDCMSHIRVTWGMQPQLIVSYK